MYPTPNPYWCQICGKFVFNPQHYLKHFQSSQSSVYSTVGPGLIQLREPFGGSMIHGSRFPSMDFPTPQPITPPGLLSQMMESKPSPRPSGSLLPPVGLQQEEKSLQKNETLWPQRFLEDIVRRVIQEQKRVEELAPSPSGSTTITTTPSSTVPPAIPSTEREKNPSPPRRTHRSSPERGQKNAPPPRKNYRSSPERGQKNESPPRKAHRSSPERGQKNGSPQRKPYRSSPEREEKKRENQYPRESKEWGFQKRYNDHQKGFGFNKREQRYQRWNSQGEKKRDFHSNDGYRNNQWKRNQNVSDEQIPSLHHGWGPVNHEQKQAAQDKEITGWKENEMNWNQLEKKEIVSKKVDENATQVVHDSSKLNQKDDRQKNTEATNWNQPEKKEIVSKTEEENATQVVNDSLKHNQKDDRQKNTDLTHPTTSLEEKNESQEKDQINDKNYLGFQQLPLQEGVIQSSYSDLSRRDKTLSPSETSILPPSKVEEQFVTTSKRSLFPENRELSILESMVNSSQKNLRENSCKNDCSLVEKSPRLNNNDTQRLNITSINSTMSQNISDNVPLNQTPTNELRGKEKEGFNNAKERLRSQGWIDEDFEDDPDELKEIEYTEEPPSERKISLFEFTVENPVPEQEEFWVRNLSPFGVIVEVKRRLDLPASGNKPARKAYIVAVSEQWKARWAFYYFKLHPATKNSFSFLSSSNLLSDCWLNQAQRQEIWNSLGPKHTKSPGGRSGRKPITKYRELVRYWECPEIPHAYSMNRYVETIFVTSRQSDNYSGYLIAKPDQNDRNPIVLRDQVLFERKNDKQVGLTLRDISPQEHGHDPIVSWLLQK